MKAHGSDHVKAILTTYDVAATVASNQLLISASTCEGIGHPFSTNCFPLFESLKGTNAANIAVTFIASFQERGPKCR
jgi:hypothetical protein